MYSIKGKTGDFRRAGKKIVLGGACDIMACPATFLELLFHFLAVIYSPIYLFIFAIGCSSCFRVLVDASRCLLLRAGFSSAGEKADGVVTLSM